MARRMNRPLVRQIEQAMIGQPLGVEGDAPLRVDPVHHSERHQTRTGHVSLQQPIVVACAVREFMQEKDHAAHV